MDRFPEAYKTVEEVVTKYGQEFDFTEPARRLLEMFQADINEEWFTEKGIEFVGEQCEAANTLRNIAQTVHEDPTIAMVPITRPIVVSGYMRSGSTFLHRLLAQDPHNFAPPMWQLIQPVPPPKMYHKDENVDQAKQGQEHTETIATDEFQRKHELDTDAPEECAFIFRHTFMSKWYIFSHHIKQYEQWLLDTPVDIKRNMYKFHKHVLQILAKYQNPKGELRYVLKDGWHMMFPEFLLETYPDACVINLLRHPHETIPSGGSLLTTAFSPLIRNLNQSALGWKLLRQSSKWCSTFLKFRQNYDKEVSKLGTKSQFIDIHYRKFIQDPLETVREIYDYFNIELTGAAVDNMKAYMEKNEKTRVKHEYTLQQIGLSKDDISTEMNDYIKYFDIKETM